MREYAYTLAERRKRRARDNDRYKTDPAYRLECINRTRRNAGRPPLASLDQSRGDMRGERNPNYRHGRKCGDAR